MSDDLTITWPTGVGPHPDLVDRLCHAVLDEIGSFATAAGWPLPDRQYVSPSAPPWDCPQVTVHAETQAGHEGTVTLAATEPWTASAGWGLASVVVEVQVVRCLTSWTEDGSRLALDQLPDVAVDEADARLHHGDPQVVRSALIAATTEGRLSPDGDWAFMGAQSLAEGDMAGQIMRFLFGIEALETLADGS